METLDTGTPLPPVVPGYTCSRLLGRGASATVWLAARNADGARFAVKYPDEGAGNPQGMERLRREASIVSAASHEHLVSIHELVKVPGSTEGGAAGIAVVMDYAPGGSLADVISARGKIGVGECVTVLTPMAQALAHLHSQGIGHGDVSPGNVLFTAQGKPLLADLGLAGLLGERQQSLGAGTPGFTEPSSSPSYRPTDALQPARDIYSLAALGWYCLTGKAPEPARNRPPLAVLVPDVPKALVGVLEAGLDPDAKARPTAKEFSAAIYRTAPPEPVDLAGSVHASVIPELLTRRAAGTRGRRRRVLQGFARRPNPAFAASPSVEPGQGKRLLLKRGLIGAGCLAVGCATWLVGSGNSVPQPAPAAAVAVAGNTPVAQPDIPGVLREQLGSPDAGAAMTALAAVRDLALNEGRPELLELVNVPGSPAAIADQSLAEQLTSQGVHLAGFSTELKAVEQASKDGNHAVMAVTAVTSSYEERNAQGQVIRWKPDGKEQHIAVVLIRVDGKWRISEILNGS